MRIPRPCNFVHKHLFCPVQMSSGALQQLKENLALAKTKRPQELGVDGAVPPDAVAIEKIKHKFLNMRKLYSPDKKVSLLLRICKLIYTIMQDNSGTRHRNTCELEFSVGRITHDDHCSVYFLPGRMYGADDFLPMLTYVVAQCDMPQLDMEIQYMMELLDPSLLQGEGKIIQISQVSVSNYLSVPPPQFYVTHISFHKHNSLV